MAQFPSIIGGFDGPAPGEFINYVSTGSVAHDPTDPSLAFVRFESGQLLVEVELDGDGDAISAYLCLTGQSPGDYIPVSPGDSVVLVWPDGQSSSAYIIARLADVDRQLAGSCCGIDTRFQVGELSRVRQFRWLRTPAGQIYAVQAGGELLLEGGGAGIRLTGAQVLVNGSLHAGDFTTPPVPPTAITGQDEAPAAPAAPLIPEPAVSPSVAVPPPPPQLAWGVVRFSDDVESNIVIDSAFWEWFIALNAFIALVSAALAIPWPYLNPVTNPLPTRIASKPTTASRRHTLKD